MGSEQEARAEIDLLLMAAGWRVQDAKAANLHAALGVAIRELPLKEGQANVDGSLKDSENLPRPKVVAQEMIEDLETALEQLRSIAADLV